jgi:hypothetical protein
MSLRREPQLSLGPGPGTCSLWVSPCGSTSGLSPARATTRVPTLPNSTPAPTVSAGDHKGSRPYSSSPPFLLLPPFFPELDAYWLQPCCIPVMRRICDA